MVVASRLDGKWATDPVSALRVNFAFRLPVNNRSYKFNHAANRPVAKQTRLPNGSRDANARKPAVARGRSGPCRSV